ncbi:hypothetical protein FE257_000771 [Aspergillus nanangensis]|uniref:Glucose-methanol-choline oxidoreductase N-terminal domain-containing protein n=1 Tax=Aspergillus nanangensis TaxID=2582783 RepID=A0AAD4GQ33_ASPNN|nr:hypothetical protein FE257_000771 [Aspergillus nanangensis]
MIPQLKHCVTGLILHLVFLSGALATPSFRGQPLTDESQLLATYDYVIIGAGVSGLTVANRLSENPNLDILVIEAGEFDKNEDYIVIPGLAGGAIGTIYDWNLTYATNSDINNRTLSIPQGKAVGGSSLLNRMVFDRGSSADYNRWKKLGNPGWGWTNLLPYFKKSEKFTAPADSIVDEWNISYDPSVHGTRGHVQSSYSPWIWPSTKHFIRAIASLGVRFPRDGASGDAVGGYFVPHNQDPASVSRSDAASAYWDTAYNRPKLHLITGRKATRLISKATRNGPIVTGVEIAISAQSSRKIVHVVREVILAAGAIHTPQILQLSGIGDPATLSRLNIPSVANVPGVGRNFQDHLYVPVVFSFDFPLTSTNLTSNSTFAAESLSLYHTKGTGPYADATGDFLTFLPARNFTTKAHSLRATTLRQGSDTYLEPDTPLGVRRGYSAQHTLLANGLVAADEAQIEILWADGTFVVGLEHPLSRGSVRLASSDPFAPPLAAPAYLRNPIDIQILVEAIKYIREIARTSSLTPFNPVELVPGAQVNSDGALEAYVRGAADTLFHPAGTCSVGQYALGGVVNQDFRVYNVGRLRVVDASVFPMLPATHIQSSVYAVAEKAAAAIMSSWKD